MKQQKNAVKNSRKPWLQALPRGQRGAATILTVLLIGVGLISVSMGAMHMVRSTQERQLAAHAQVNSQAGVWATVETVRTYLQTLTKEQLTTLNENQTWAITGIDNLSQQAVLTNVTLPVGLATEFKVRAILTATDLSARSSSSVEVIYNVTPGVAPKDYKLNGVLDFYNTLELAGGITLDIPGNNANFNVDGDFIAKSVGIAGADNSQNPLNKIAVTGNVVVNSAVKANEVWGRNVFLYGGSGVKKIRAFGDPDGTGKMPTIDKDGVLSPTNKADTCCGNVVVTGGTAGEDIQANGSVTLMGGSAGTVNARRDVFIVPNEKGGGGGMYNFVTARNITADIGASLNHAAATGNIWYKYAVGSFTPAQTSSSSSSSSSAPSAAQTVTAVGNIRCGNDDNPDVNLRTHTWHKYGVVRAGGTNTNCATTSPGSMAPAVPLPKVQLMEPLLPITLKQPTVNAWALQASANYAIEKVGSDYKVTVKNVNGIANGIYFLAGYNATGVSKRELLCSTVDASGYCVTKVKEFCSGTSPNDPCFSEITLNGKTYLNLKGGTLPPGVIWVKGNLKIELGIFYNTFIATGNIYSGGSVKTYAVNFAAAYKNDAGTVQNAICKNQADPQVKDDLFNGMYPTNYCTAAGEFIPNAQGNIGLLAGGYPPGTTAVPNPPYSGGLIELGAANKTYGSVIAGNLLETHGQTDIFGYVSAAGLQLSDTEINKFDGATKIILKDLPDTYKPEEIPDMSAEGAGQTAAATVLWSRYL